MFTLGGYGYAMIEMDLETSEEDSDATAELALIAAPVLDPGGDGRGRCPPENPAVDPITEELLIDPHPDEPGVRPDGTATPLENPGRYHRRPPAKTIPRV